tara:strand:+ start:36 stop:581 length:546 start_codon:yes stop_codon:yes gene_type:complete
MIIPEEILEKVFDTLPEITIAGIDHQCFFNYGTLEELILLLNEKETKQESRYPLIWLLTEFKETGDIDNHNKTTIIDLKLVLATFSNEAYTSKESLEATFKPTLFPLLQNIVKALDQSGRTQRKKKDETVRYKFYKKELKEIAEKQFNIILQDTWDAIRFECTLELNDSQGEIRIIYKNNF